MPTHTSRLNHVVQPQPDWATGQGEEEDLPNMQTGQPARRRVNVYLSMEVGTPPGPDSERQPERETSSDSSLLQGNCYFPSSVDLWLSPFRSLLPDMQTDTCASCGTKFCALCGLEVVDDDFILTHDACTHTGEE